MFPYSLGAVKDLEDKRDILLSNYLIPQKLPKVIDWEDIEIPIKNQGGQPACVGYSCAGMKEIQEKIEHNEILAFDGLKLYQECKKIDGIPSQGGTYIRVALKILQQAGIPIDKKFYKIASYTRLEAIEDMKFALVSSGPIVVGVHVFETWRGIEERCYIPLPEESQKPLGGHAIMITGYDDNIGAFHFKNSWGANWGCKGKAWLTYPYIKSYLLDAWAVVDLKDEVAGTFLNTQKIVEDIEKINNSDKKL